MVSELQSELKVASSFLSYNSVCRLSFLLIDGSCCSVQFRWKGALTEVGKGKRARQREGRLRKTTIGFTGISSGLKLKELPTFNNMKLPLP